MRILILKEEGIGNAILTIPMIVALRRKFPGALIDVVASPRNHGILDGLPEIDNIYVFGNPIYNKYDYGILTEWSSGAFVGDTKQYFDKLVKHPGRDYEKWSEAEHNLQIIAKEPFNAWNGEWVEARIHIDRADHSYARELVRGMVTPYVVVHTGCLTNKLVWRNRRWIIDGWINLIKLIKAEYGVEVVIIGTLEDKYDADRIKDRVAVADFTGRTTIKQTAALLQHAKLYISIDNGPMHIAASVGTPQIALFGPTSELKSMPHRKDGNCEIVRHDTKCAQCYIRHPDLFRTCDNPECMRGITPEMVMERIKTRGWL